MEIIHIVYPMVVILVIAYGWYTAEVPVYDNDACLWSRSWTSYVGPCQSGGDPISPELNDTIVPQNSMLVITIPINARIKHQLTIYTGQAKQVYFPEVSYHYDYVYIRFPDRPRDKYVICTGDGYVERNQHHDLVLKLGDRSKPQNVCII